MAEADREVLPPRVTMPLLTLITQQSLDEDYLHAAERKAMAGQRPAAERPRWGAVVALAVFGVLVAIAASQTSRNEGIEDAGRNSLIAQINEGREEVADLQARIADLRGNNAELEADQVNLISAQQTVVASLRRLQVRTGFVAVRGPGVRVVIREPEQGTERIRKEDLFLVINGLWAAGAEAVALNGHRISAMTWLSNSSVAINVDLAPIAAPYSITAIGDPRTLSANLIETSTFSTFTGLASTYGFAWAVQDDDAISMPAARQKRLVSATTDQDDQRNRENQP